MYDVFDVPAMMKGCRAEHYFLFGAKCRCDCFNFRTIVDGVQLFSISNCPIFARELQDSRRFSKQMVKVSPIP